MRDVIPQPGATFDTVGTEGMLDVVLGCTLVFMLLTALVNIERGKAQEVALPPIDLTKATGQASGAQRTRRLAVSVGVSKGEPQIWIEERPVSLAELEQELRTAGGGGLVQVALRRATDVPCGLEDAVILACRRAGIERVALVVRQE